MRDITELYTQYKGLQVTVETWQKDVDTGKGVVNDAQTRLSGLETSLQTSEKVFGETRTALREAISTQIGEKRVALSRASRMLKQGDLETAYLVLTGRDVQFYASSKKGKPSGKNQFQLFLEANGIGHILARVNHPQTCGKVERIFGEIKTRIEKRHDFDSVEETIEWHNNIKPHMSLSDEQELITPAQAFQRKMHHNAKVIKAFVEVG